MNSEGFAPILAGSYNILIDFTGSYKFLPVFTNLDALFRFLWINMNSFLTLREFKRLHMTLDFDGAAEWLKQFSSGN